MRTESPEFEELTEEEKRLIDGLFPNYLFYKPMPNGDREFHCTHCRQVFIKARLTRTVTPEERKLMSVGHGDEVRCPLCGAAATVKSIGRSKQRKNLWHREKVVILHAVNHDRVEARCYFAQRDYEPDLVPETELYEESRYLLIPGNATKYRPTYPYDKFYSISRISEPFPNTGMFYGTDDGYTVFGLNRLENTFLKYNQLDSYVSYDAQHYSDYIYNGPMMKYLSYFATYPQLEMLQKLGHNDIVRKLVNENLKSSPYVNWKAQSIADFFKMSKQEYKSFKENGGTLELLKFVYYIRTGKSRFDFEKANAYLKKFGSQKSFEYFADSLRDCGVSLPDGVKYVLQNERNYIEYADYLRMAYILGYDLKVHNVAFPKNLKTAHDNAAVAERAMLEEKRMAAVKEQEQKATKYLKKYEKQYSFTAGKYTIIIPHTVKEIIEEGKNMCHCVGGYAGRHMEGALAILFLRLAAKPDKSLYTIEMHGKTLTQVQGYRNRTPLTPEAKAFFDMWLDWVKKGSRRDKSGNPILQTEIQHKTA